MRISINRRRAKLVQSEVITVGSVGMELELNMSPEWQGLGITAVFTGSGVTKDRLVTNGKCVVPAECLVTEGDILTVGIYGTNGTTVVIPTVYVELGAIEEGAEPSGDSSEADVITHYDEIIGNITTLNAAKHTHSNKTVLDGITSETIENISGNTAARHTHGNMSILNSIVPNRIGAWDNAATYSHTHSNKTVLDQLTSDLLSKLTSYEGTYRVTYGVTTGTEMIANMPKRKITYLIYEATLYILFCSEYSYPEFFAEFISIGSEKTKVIRYSGNAWAEPVEYERVNTVKVAGTSVIDDAGVANIPAADSSNYGVVKVSYTYGTAKRTDGTLYTVKADNTELAAGTNSYKSIVPANLGAAVKAALTGDNYPTWTADEQQAAQIRLGILSAEGVGF